MRYRILGIMIPSFISLLFIFALIARINWTEQLCDEENYDNLVVSFFQKDYKGFLDEIERQLSDSRVIITATATGKKEYVYGNLKQEVKLERALRGKVPVSDGKKLQFTGNGRIEHSKGKKLTVATGFVNYLQKGHSYLIFADKCSKDYDGKEYILNATESVIGLRCMDLTENKSKICRKPGTQTEYKNVKNSEFFTNDEGTLKEILAMKKRLLRKFNI